MWNSKFSRKEYLYGTEPNLFISENVDNLIGKAICFGEGEGRNAIFLAERGFSVTALDSSEIGLQKAEKLAQSRNVQIELVQSLAENFDEVENYDLAVSSFMHVPEQSRKAVFEKILLSLKSGGTFVGEFFSKGQLSYSSGGPKSLELLYSEKEIVEMLKDMPCKILQCREEIVSLNEGVGHQGKASVLRIKLIKN
jgi:hypothetical protein